MRPNRSLQEAVQKVVADVKLAVFANRGSAQVQTLNGATGPNLA